MPQPVYTLLCERDLPMALVTLPNILRFLGPEQQLIIVDDGTFTSHTIEKLSQLSRKIQVITRSERESFVLDALKDFPQCRSFREELPFAFKLLDIPLLAQRESSRFTYTDTDIIYLKNCTEYFNRDVNTFLRTDAIKISVKLKNVFFKYKWDVPYKFNAGYFSFNSNDFDLGMIEFFLSRPDVRNMPWVMEQTAWALLFGQSGPCYCPSEKQFVCRENFNSPEPETLAIHLISNLKSKLNVWAIQEESKTGTIEKPIFELSRNVNMLDWVKKSTRRYLPSI